MPAEERLYLLPKQNLEDESAKLNIEGSPSGESFNVRYAIPGAYYALKTINLALFASRETTGEISGVFRVQSEVVGGSSFDPSPLIDRPATVNETMFLTRLIELRFPSTSDKEIVRGLARTHILYLMEEAQREKNETEAEVRDAELALRRAREGLQTASIQLNQVKKNGARALDELNHNS